MTWTEQFSREHKLPYWHNSRTNESVWEKPADDGYYFKKSHAVAYANLVAVNINLISEQE